MRDSGLNLKGFVIFCVAYIWIPNNWIPFFRSSFPSSFWQDSYNCHKFYWGFPYFSYSKYIFANFMYYSLQSFQCCFIKLMQCVCLGITDTLGNRVQRFFFFRLAFYLPLEHKPTAFIFLSLAGLSSWVFLDLLLLLHLLGPKLRNDLVLPWGLLLMRWYHSTHFPDPQLPQSSGLWSIPGPHLSIVASEIVLVSDVFTRVGRGGGIGNPLCTLPSAFWCFEFPLTHPPIALLTALWTFSKFFPQVPAKDLRTTWSGIVKAMSFYRYTYVVGTLLKQMFSSRSFHIAVTK